MNVFYFLGTAPHHINHTLQVYNCLGGEFIVMSREGADICEKMDVKYKMLEEHPFQQHYNVSQSEKTIEYLNNQEGTMFFYQPANIIKEFTSLVKIFAF